MKKNLATKVTGIALSATLAFSGIAAAQTAAYPIDTKGSYAKDTINHLYDAGIVHGVDAKHYKPKALVSRAEFIAMVDRVLNLPLDSTSKTTSYTDVKGWAVPFINAAHDHHILTDLGTTQIHPNSGLTLEEGASIMVNALEQIAKIVTHNTVNFKDKAKVDAWATHAVDVALDYGLIQVKKDNNLHPTTVVNREEAAVLISHFMHTLEYFKAHAGVQKDDTSKVTPKPVTTNTTTTTSNVSYSNSSSSQSNVSGATYATYSAQPVTVPLVAVTTATYATYGTQAASVTNATYVTVNDYSRASNDTVTLGLTLDLAKMPVANIDGIYVTLFDANNNVLIDQVLDQANLLKLKAEIEKSNGAIKTSIKMTDPNADIAKLVITLVDKNSKPYIVENKTPLNHK